MNQTKRNLALGALALGMVAACLWWPNKTRVGKNTAIGPQSWIQWSARNGGNDHYYAITSVATNWIAAEEIAIASGGHLAMIRNAQEQGFINQTFLIGALEHRPVWIGLVDTAPASAFREWMRKTLARFGIGGPSSRFSWVTQEPLSYTNWKPGEPNNSPPGEQYVAINWGYSDSPPRGRKGDWNDTPLKGTAGYGGSTSGPYFGLVEMATDPRAPMLPRPASSRLMPFAWILLATGSVSIVGLMMRKKALRR